MNEPELLEELEKINREYEQKERFLKYYELIDKLEIPFTIWLPCQYIDREFIYKWLERWDIVPEKVIESVVKRFDYLLFYDILIKKGCFLPFIHCILSMKEVTFDDINIIYNLIGLKEHQTDFMYYLKNTYDDYRYQKNSNWVSAVIHPPIKQLKYIKNLIFLLVNMYKRPNRLFLFQWIILFYDLSVFNITNYNKFPNSRSNISFIYLINTIHKYIFFNFLNQHCFQNDLFYISTPYGSIDLINELITLYSKAYIQIGSESVLETLADIFNNHYDKLNILQRIKIVQCINYNISYHNDDENIFIGFQQLDIHLLQQLYIEMNKLDDHISYKLSILLFMVSILQKIDKQLTNKKFIYHFIRDLFKLLDDLTTYCDLYEELLQSGDRDDYYNQCISYLNDTNAFIETFASIMVVEKSKPDSLFYSSELQKKIIDGCILHIKTLHNMNYKYHTIKTGNEDFNPVYYINVLMDGILFYKDSDRFTMYMNNCKTTLSAIEHDIAKNNTEFRRYLNRAKFLEEELDETKLDAITSELLYDPVTLPTSKMTVNRDTIKLHLYENDSDPFTKIKFTKREIEEFLK